MVSPCPSISVGTLSRGTSLIFFRSSTPTTKLLGPNSTIIALIPKKSGANRVQDFTTISLISASYKIIAKILSNRIREVMPDIIDRNHYTFIKGRQILDSVLIANECVEDYKRRKQKGGVVKLALEKAYDKTNRNFLDFVLARKGFGAKWRSWMHGCLSSTHFQVIINGSPKGFFPTSRGLRQGDPFHPSYSP